MTNDELDAIEARTNAATVGPWHVWSDTDELVDIPRPSGTSPYPLAQCDQQDFTARIYAADYRKRDHRTSDNAYFIAHARTDVPALVAEVRRLRRLVRAAYYEGVDVAGGSGGAYAERESTWLATEAHRALDGPS